MKVIIVGNKGRIGATLSRILSESGNIVSGFDFHNNNSLDEYVDKADVAIIATPFDVTVNYLKKISARITCIEVTSSKCAMRIFQNRVISIHPLFGPYSFRNEGLRNIAYISDISPIGSLQLVRNLFGHFNVIPMTAVEHDFLISKIQVIPYIISLLAKRVRSDSPLKTRSEEILDSMAAICDEQNMTVLLDTIVMNPFSLNVIEEIEKNIKELGGELSDRSADFWLQHRSCSARNA